MSEALKKALSYGLLSALLLIAQPAAAQGYEACGPLHTPGGYGPIDYRQMTPDQKRLVEGAHFTPEVESLTRGHTTVIGGDIDYTLRVFPNHPRALYAMMKLAAREGTVKPRGSRYTMECWFDRAIRFQPDDGAVHLLYGIYLERHDKNKQAIEQLETASKLLGDQDGNAHYNLGLAYVEVKQYDKALIHAHKAYKLGFNLPGLREKLERVGKWKDPTPTAPPSAAAESPIKGSPATEPGAPESAAAAEASVKESPTTKPSAVEPAAAPAQSTTASTTSSTTASTTAPDNASHPAPSDSNGSAGNSSN